MESSPIENIAKMIDFYFPYLVKNLLDIVEHQETEALNKTYDLDIPEGSKHKHLIEYFGAIAKAGNIDDFIFFMTISFT